MSPPRSSASTNLIWPLLLALAALIALYAGSYYWMVEHSGSVYVVLSHEGDHIKIAPTYPFGGVTSEVFYYPAYRLDRLLRPERWRIDARSAAT